jgi:hypothetical protein
MRPANVPPDALVQINPERDPRWTTAHISLSEFVDVAENARTVMTKARPIMPADLSVSSDRITAGVNVQEFGTRADSIVAALRSAHTILAAAITEPASADLETVRLALMRIAHFRDWESGSRIGRGGQ